jgi:sigma-B regulation protein RsbU (phosphoserine phosphatase)
MVPIFLILVLAWLGAYIINGQFAAFLVTLRLRDHYDQLEQLNRVVAHEVHRRRVIRPDELLDGLQEFYLTELSGHAASYPGLEVTLRLDGRWRAFRLDGHVLEQPVAVPAWLNQEEFAGFVMDGAQVFLRAVARTRTPEGELQVVLSQPFSTELLDLVGQGIGPVGVLISPTGQPGTGTQSSARQGSGAPGGESEYRPVATVVSKSVALPEPAYPFDYKVYGASTLDPVIWGGSREERMAEPVFVYASSRIVTLNKQLFVTLGRYSAAYVTLFIIVTLVFLGIELLALIIGVRLTRSMTEAVDHLYDATERVQAGELSYRIGLPADDQLSALGGAFDNMTASVERLLRASEEKLRLESDVEIAQEVQRQLFPREVPVIEGVELYGVCHPARGVSGDYYDFLQLEDGRVGLVLGDVSGKGISAALLMAAIRSALHAQFYDGQSAGGTPAIPPISTADVVARLNRLLCESTSAEKYATFFYAVYENKTHRLTYTNAGHVAPALFRQGAIRRLDVGGTVIGLFPAPHYAQAEIELDPGDLLLAFTDGLTEPENTYGEEFGEERIFQAVESARSASPEELAEEIYRSVADWTGDPELQDDMTLIVAKSLD